MTITNGYCTLSEFKSALVVSGTPSTSAADDSFIEDCIERASRHLDSLCGRRFFIDTETRYHDTPATDSLYIDDADLYAITTLTNGDATTISSTNYKLYPLNSKPKYEIRLLLSSGVVWETSASGDAEGAITIAGSWGYVDRSQTDSASLRVIEDSRLAALELAMLIYKRRAGQYTEGAAEVTAAGVVLTPSDLPPSAANFVKVYRVLTHEAR